MVLAVSLTDKHLLISFRYSSVWPLQLLYSRQVFYQSHSSDEQNRKRTPLSKPTSDFQNGANGKTSGTTTPTLHCGNYNPRRAQKWQSSEQASKRSWAAVTRTNTVPMMMMTKSSVAFRNRRSRVIQTLIRRRTRKRRSRSCSHIGVITSPGSVSFVNLLSYEDEF